MTPDEAAAYTRQTLAGSLRSRKPYNVRLHKNQTNSIAILG